MENEFHLEDDDLYGDLRKHTSCPECGSELDEDNRCPSCGKVVK